ncbi:hypothetical protein ANO14919_091780 [Xylariales sp. No.14919]|nr:hypothetical protein ANO14919_091780 [Xylariales sp. No.14919]
MERKEALFQFRRSFMQATDNRLRSIGESEAAKWLRRTD